MLELILDRLENEAYGVDVDNPSNFVELSSKKSIEGIHKQGLITEKIKDASVKIMCVGVVIGLTVLVSLKFVPRKGGHSVKPEHVGLAVAPDVSNLGYLVKDNMEKEVMRMDAKLAGFLVRRWHSAKAQALGSSHCLEELSEVLDGKMLKIWMDRAKDRPPGWSTIWMKELLKRQRG